MITTMPTSTAESLAIHDRVTHFTPQLGVLTPRLGRLRGCVAYRGVWPISSGILPMLTVRVVRMRLKDKQAKVRQKHICEEQQLVACFISIRGTSPVRMDGRVGQRRIKFTTSR